jgi:hypothetical protein
MTQYLLAIRRDYAVPRSPEETRQKWAGVVALNNRMTDEGAFVFQGGLIPPESAIVVRPAGGDFLLTDGPYAETKEHLAGFYIINAGDLDEALEWAKLAAAAQQRPVEVRAFFGGDLDDAILAGVRESNAEVSERNASGAQ